ncbi:astacin-like metalloendopeptidase isoform X2 [Paramacrobiotus metropolitanus]|uniref:astacin-like metalloendopeptidase isoform X2 n=1 Tax=Paramacrobiotus metropolitanus TaxID=2943436 RepID=UPI002445A974|nr:astacin-like metalloendopeptidase isoform X2 [Paramacrobiotus metropolitanus]
MFDFVVCFVLSALDVFTLASPSNLPTNWREFIDPDILAKGSDASLYDSDLLEGDITGLEALELSHGAANAIDKADSFWPNNTIPYTFSKKQFATLTPQEIRIVLESMDIISHLTGNCIQFVERTDEEDYINFQKGLQCMSNIGRTGGKQTVTYATGCLKNHGDVQHELMHTMGFFHEHSRADRDQHVIIIWDNIDESDKEQFAIHESGNTYGLPYDYESIMHYKYNAFAKDSSIPTIVPKAKRAKIGQSENLSPLDITRIHRRFRCPVAAASTFIGGSKKTFSTPQPLETDDRTTTVVTTRKRILLSSSSVFAHADEPFPTFSLAPMRADECKAQNTQHCQPPWEYQECAAFKGLLIVCMYGSPSIEEITAMTTSMSKPPLRPIEMHMADGPILTSHNFRLIQKQVIAFELSNCENSRSLGRLPALGFANLLELNIIECDDLDIGKNDLISFRKLRIFTVKSRPYSSSPPIRTLEKDSFSDLPDLRVISLEYDSSLHSQSAL